MLERLIIVFQIPILALVAILAILLFPITIVIYVLFGYNILNTAIEKLMEII